MLALAVFPRSLEHDADGCGTCACGARCLEDLTSEDQDDLLEAEVGRVVAFLKAARARRQKADENREVTVSARRTDIKPRMVKRRKPKAPAAEPKAPRAAMTRPATARGKAIVRAAAPSPPLPSYEEDGRIHFEEDALEAVLAG